MTVIDNQVERVWELEYNGKPSININKGCEAHFDGRIMSPGEYVLVVETHQKISAAPNRIVKAYFTVSEEGKDLVSAKRKVCSNNDKVCYRFSVEAPAQWFLQLSCKAVRKIKVTAHIANEGQNQQHEEAEQSPRKINEWTLEDLPLKEQQRVLNVTSNWPARQGTSRLNYSQEMAVEELQKESKYKDKAFKEGIIRPFLFLVSMHPEDRIRLAHSLGMNLVEKKYFGDAHRESWHILTENRNGIQARANHAYSESLHPLAQNSNWYLILQRVCRKSLSGDGQTRTDDKVHQVEEAHRSKSESMKICRDMESEEMLALENMFAYAVADVVDYNLEQHQPETWHRVHDLMQDDCQLAPLLEKLELAGYTDESHMRLLAALALVGNSNVAAEISSLQRALDKADDIRTARATARMAIPLACLGGQLILHAVVATTLVFVPLLLIPTTMLAVYSAGLIFTETPARLLLPLLAIVMQKETLAYHDIHIEAYYPLIAQSYRNTSIDIGH